MATRRSGGYAACKRALEWALSVVLLVLAAPAILVIMALVKLTSRGPALYSQARVGLDGRLFVIYKIRTMLHNCESLSGHQWATKNDPRVTPIGHFLRRSHLDELPQLWNVLRGEMSLVGPRPERPEFVSELECEIPRYRDRLSVRPGLAGLAQSRLPPDSDLGDVERKLAFDLYYIQHFDLWLDLRLLICTALFLTGIPFRLSCHLLRIPILETAMRACRNPGAEVEAIPSPPELA